MAKNGTVLILQQNIEKLMLRHKLRLIPLAKKCGISKGLLWKLTTDPKANPTLSTLDAISSAFGISTSELLLP